MSINNDYLALLERLEQQVTLPDIVALHLPELQDDGECRDQFGFIFLSDGSAAPFYVSLPGMLNNLWQSFPEPAQAQLSLKQALSGFRTQSFEQRALAIGAFNAISHSVFKAADYSPPSLDKTRGFRPEAGEEIGMVGYFGPVIDQMVERGVKVLVIERQPQRVREHSLVRCSSDVSSLAGCRMVYCTASTLINDSLDEILQSCPDTERVDLIGPSGSGLPDVLFKHGIHAVGGVIFEDLEGLKQGLEEGQSWGKLGRKYEILASEYPGVEHLIGVIQQR